jgi:hypothetical protein
MSHVLVDNITNREGGAIGISSGAVVTGVVTATSFVGDGSGLSGIDATALKDSGGSVKVQGNTSGIIVTGISTFSSNVSIGGTLIYDDVTNIDSVGVVTARAGIKIGAGQSVSAVSGIVTYYGDGSKLSGVESGVVNFVASGDIGNGQTVIIKTDGTVGIVTTVTSGNVVGSDVIFNSSATTNMNQIAYDSDTGKIIVAYCVGGSSGYAIVGSVDASDNSIDFSGNGASSFNGSETEDIAVVSLGNQTNKFVVAYRDNGNSDHGYAKMGTISGTTITFSTAYSFNTAGTTNEIQMTYDENAERIIITFRDYGNSYQGTAIVGSVASNGNITFGSKTVYNSAQSLYNISVYDPDSQKIVIAYRDVGESNSGRAIVGTVSGTSISFGSEAVFDSTYGADFHKIAYDTANNKVVIGYKNTNSNGMAVVGTVSGTSITFGTPVAFDNTSGAKEYINTSYDPDTGKVLIAYRDNGNSNYGTLIEGTVSGTTISFANKIVFHSGSTSSICSAYDTNANRTALVYMDGGDSNKGKAIVYQTQAQSTNLTTENYIGIAAEAISDTATGKINVVGGTNTGQTGLTTALKYFVQNSGGISTTASSPSVVAGTAISDTKIVVR